MQQITPENGLPSCGMEPEIVMLLGVSERSGTNYVCDIVSQHPSCQRVKGVWEDGVLKHLDLLHVFTGALAGFWKPHWDPEGEYLARLDQHLIGACEDFLAKLGECPGAITEENKRYVFTKTPSVDNLRRAGSLERCRVLVLVRDGRSVVASGMRGFGWAFSIATNRWSKAVDEISAAENEGVKFHLLRYEDVVRSPEETLSKVFNFLGLELDGDLIQKIEELPIRGSSTLKARSNDVHWDPIVKTAEFNRLNRHEEWGQWRQFCFALLAQRQSEYLGYQIRTIQGFPVYLRVCAPLIKFGLMTDIFVRGYLGRLKNIAKSMASRIA